MSNEYRRLLSARKFTTGAVQAVEEAWDAGSYSVLHVQCRILKTGSAGGFMTLQHSATNEEGSFIAITGASWELNTAGDFMTVANFLRYVRWATSGTVAGDPIAQIDIVAKNPA